MRLSRADIRSVDGLRFVPSAVEGLPEVSEVALFPDRLELMSTGQRKVFRFVEFAHWHRFGSIYRAIASCGLGVYGQPCVANRDWFHPPSRRFFQFYTAPRLKIFLADEAQELPYGESLFCKIRETIALGGFDTFDLG